ncbi:hypothetical protein PLESTB_000348100 [Pleodorina starrii]|uniref:G domain-containing protein n=1 Tax=Pleodorina starrii TaxID=330485 RepID=A0A9W6BEJ9_9CHLO|nr:hypothetical protein PLESTM_000046700 [Pleodorina starrii]GLC50152.1 hypothetical protein PLESTB_000348100 [Pleodorina starrii]GLC73067.1 hypothetical protein PLESTF_001328300 [Pleodorina starrii]
MHCTPTRLPRLLLTRQFNYISQCKVLRCSASYFHYRSFAGRHHDFGLSSLALASGERFAAIEAYFTIFARRKIASSACEARLTSAVAGRAPVMLPVGDMRCARSLRSTSCSSAPRQTAWPLFSATPCAYRHVLLPLAPALQPTALTQRHFSSKKPAHAASSTTAESAATAESEPVASVSSSTARAGRGRRPVGTGAGSEATAPAAAAPSASDLAAANLLSDEALRAMGVKLPTHCCGCGMKLQRQDERAPGFFTVPARLLEPKEESPAVAAPAAEGEADEAPVVEFEDVGRLSGDEPDVLCQRCYWLTHSGKLKSYVGEAALPSFDLGKKVGRKIYLQKDRKAVVLVVVDMWDFDGSLPRQAIRALLPPGTGDEAPEELKWKLMVAANKFDLLPSAATVPRVQQWVRTRLKQAGLPHAEKVFMVSAAKGLGVKDMVQDIRQALGFRGDLWVVGAQNAGKSSLIRAMKRLAGTDGKGDPTVAPVPGTTLGLLQVPGIPLGPKHRTFDTPGVPHAHQLTSYLSTEVVRKVLPSKQLRGRTYRIEPGHTVLLGAGLARLDVVSAPGPTLYLTVFVSAHVNLHMGKTEGVDGKMQSLADNGLLAPPDSAEDVAALPQWEAVEVEVEGSDWSRSSVDVAIAGLGWVAVGCRGRARLRVWTLPGVTVTTHAALIPDYAREFEKKGVSSLLPRPPKKEQAKPAKKV